METVEPGGAILRVAVAWPEGDGPVPVVIVLHGTEGFNEHDVYAAEAFAAAGFLGVAGCWFASAECPHGPAFRGATLVAIQHVRTLITTVLRLPRARADGVALFGHSRGGTLALLAASTESSVHAVVASSAQYSVTDTGGKRPAALDVAPVTVAVDLRVPVLILHATGDAVSDVGAAQFESHYYEGSDGYYTTRAHELAFNPNTADDIIRRSIRFLKQHLGI